MCVSARGCWVVSRTAAKQSGRSAWFWPNSIDLCFLSMLYILSCLLTSSQCCSLCVSKLACLSLASTNCWHRCWFQAAWRIAFSPLSLSFFSNVYVSSPCRLKGHPADIPDGGKWKPASQPEDTSSTHITPPHHCEMKTSRLPTLPEEESSDLKAPDPVPLVREEADGKDDAAEVNTHNIHKQTDTQSQTWKSPSSSSSSRTWWTPASRCCSGVRASPTGTGG